MTNKDIPEGYQLSTPEELAHHERVTTTVASAIKEMGVEAFGLVYAGPGGKIRSGLGGWSTDALAAVMTVGADCFRLTVERWMGGLGGTTMLSVDGEAAAYRLTVGDDRRPVKQIAEILLDAFRELVQGKKEASSGEPFVPEIRGNRVGDEGIVIHVLQMGRACCGQPGIPADWPVGHRWVSLMKKGDATCKLCIQALDDKDIRKPR